VCVLFNPRAGSADQIAALRDALAGRRKVTLRELGPDDDLKQVVAEVARGRCDLIAVAGGDGTVHAAVNRLAPDFPDKPLAILPLGTGNDLCRTLAVPLDPVAALDLWKTGRRRMIDVIRVEGDRAGYAVNAVTGGFSGRVAADVTSEMKEFWGPLAYLRGAAGPIAERESYRVTFRFDDGPPEPMDVYNLVVANGRTAAGGLPVAPLANPEDGLLDVVVIPAGDLLNTSVVAARLMAGDYHADESVLHRRARRVEVECDLPIPVSFDGELTEGRRFAFTVVPKALRVIAGPDYRPNPKGEPPEADDWDADAAGRGLGSRLFGLIAALMLLVVRMPRGAALGLGLAAVAVLGFGLLAKVVLAGEWDVANRAALEAMRPRESPQLTAFAEIVTDAGHWVTTAVFGAGLVAVYAARRRYLDAATLLAVLVGCGLLELLLKWTFQVERPGPYDPATAVSVYSFPSGHALRGVGLYLCVAALVVARDLRSVWRWLLATGCVLLAAAVCWSRPYLHVHWPGDVVAGALAAVAWVSGCLVARHRVQLRLAARAPNPPASSRTPSRSPV
jgi:diacylglycerol kinase (ATP)